MKFLKLLVVLLCAQALIATADEQTMPTEGKKATKPSLTYYYFDG